MSADASLVKRCPACGAESPPQALRCGCGTLLAGLDLTPRATATPPAAIDAPAPTGDAPPGRTCPHADCGQANRAEAVRCIYCDRPLDVAIADVPDDHGVVARVRIEWPWDEHTTLVGTLLVGRNEPALAAHCRTRYDNVSRRHAELRIDATGVWIRDLGSANGTFVNEVRLAPGEPVRLRDGARLRFAADLVATLRIGDARG